MSKKVLIILVGLLILGIAMTVMTANRQVVLSDKEIDAWGESLAIAARSIHQSFTINGLAIQQPGGNAGGYDEVDYSNGSGQPLDPAYRSNLKQILQTSPCDLAALKIWLNQNLSDSLDKMKILTLDEAKDKLACLGRLEFTKLGFSSD